jgi:ferrochelatase
VRALPTHLPARAQGDTYTGEVAATTRAVMERLQARTKLEQVPKHVLAWQSKVGYMPWMAPSTADAIKHLGKQGHKRVLVVPIAFTSDHIETLFEIAIEYAHLAKESGIEEFDYTAGLNGSGTFAQALCDVVSEHLDRKENYGPQYKMRCLTCNNAQCRGIMNAAF